MTIKRKKCQWILTFILIDLKRVWVSFWLTSGWQIIVLNWTYCYYKNSVEIVPV